MIEWSETIDGDQSARYDGRALCSLKDPKKEARLWVEGQTDLSGFSYVDVVGIGLGYHLMELIQKFPQIKVRAFDSKNIEYKKFPHALRQQFEKMAAQVRFVYGEAAVVEAQKQIPLGPVLSFRSACQEVDLEIYQMLLGQSPKQFLQLASYNGLNFNQALQNLPSNLAVNLKTLSTEKMAPEALETKLLQVLQELMQ